MLKDTNVLLNNALIARGVNMNVSFFTIILLQLSPLGGWKGRIGMMRLSNKTSVCLKAVLALGHIKVVFLFDFAIDLSFIQLL